MIQNQWDCLISLTRNRDHVFHLWGFWVAAFVNIYKNVLHCSSKRHYKTHAKLLLNSRIQIKRELDLNHHWMLFLKTKLQAVKFCKAKPSPGTHQQKGLPGWAWRSCAELLSAASHSCIFLMQRDFFVGSASFPTAAKYVKQAARDL